MIRYQEKSAAGNQVSTRKFPEHGFVKTGASWGGWIRTTDYLIQSSRSQKPGQNYEIGRRAGRLIAISARPLTSSFRPAQHTELLAPSALSSSLVEGPRAAGPHGHGTDDGSAVGTRLVSLAIFVGLPLLGAAVCR